MSVQVPKGYKQTEVGVIPEDWSVLRLKDISPSQSVGLVINPSTYVESNGVVPMLVGSNIEPNKINWIDARKISVQSNDSLPASRLRSGDIVVVRVGEPGISAVVPPEIDGCNCASVMIVRRHERFNSSWLSYLFNSLIGLQQIENVQYGTAQKQFNISDAVNFVYPYPSLVEQQAIAEALSDADALIESLEQLIAKKRQIKQGAMQELLTGQRRLPGFGGEWIEKSFGELFEFSGGFSASREDLSLEGYCYLHYGDIHGSKKQYIDTLKDFSQIPKLQIDLKKISSKSLLKNGDVVFVDASEDDSGVSKHIVVRNEKDIPFISGLHTIVAKQKTNLLTREYLEYCFSNEIIHNQFIHYSVGTKVTGISKKNIAKIFVKFPPQDEQLAISKILSDIDEDISELLMRLDKARQIKQAMMQELLTGHIRLL